MDRIVPGLIFIPDFITEKEEEELRAAIDRNEWRTDISRRVQHYGWLYDYSKMQLDETKAVEDLPDWARELGKRLVNRGLVSTCPDQVIVNEYVKDQGIARHVDKIDSFAECIATVSLLETWEMVFRPCDRSKRNLKKSIALARRSVAVMTGDARYKWTHEIPKRKSEPNPDPQDSRKRIGRKRRISLTFRTKRQS